MAGGPMAAAKAHCPSLWLWRAWIVGGDFGELELSAAHHTSVVFSSVSRGPKKLAAGKPSHGQTRLGKKLIFLCFSFDNLYASHVFNHDAAVHVAVSLLSLAEAKSRFLCMVRALIYALPWTMELTRDEERAFSWVVEAAALPCSSMSSKWIFLVLMATCGFFLCCYTLVFSCMHTWWNVLGVSLFSSGHGVCFLDVLHYLSVHLYFWMCEWALTSAMFLGVVLRLLVQ
jgi:hypothetical protein